MEEMLRSGAVAMDLKQQLGKVCFCLVSIPIWHAIQSSVGLQ
jgi:hypothetical protein